MLLYFAENAVGQAQAVEAGAEGVAVAVHSVDGELPCEQPNLSLDLWPSRELPLLCYPARGDSKDDDDFLAPAKMLQLL